MELQQRFQRMHALTRAEPEVPYVLRAGRLARLEALLVTHGGALAAAMDDDFGGRSVRECELFDLFPTLAEVRHQRRHLRRYMRPRRERVPWYLMPARAEVRPDPLGLVGVLSPWNFPVFLAIAPVAAALAAGNRVLLKPSELAPHTSTLLGALVAQHFDADELSVCLGDRVFAERFSTLPFDHLLFTGSTAVGRSVAVAAAHNLTPVTLELGGKSPAVIAPSADLSRAAHRLMFGKLTNAGQICIAPDYALVPRARMHGLVAALREAAHRLYPRFVGNPDYTALKSEVARQRMAALLADAAQHGAELVRLSGTGEDDGHALQRSPVLVLDPPAQARVMREELFAPILPIVPYDTLDGAIAFVNARERPLALYVFARDSAEITRVCNHTRSGGVTVNDVFYHCGCGTLPFGGIGASGMGAYHGRAGFDTFSHQKSVYYQSRSHPGAMLEPPYGAMKDRVRSWLKRIV